MKKTLSLLLLLASLPVFATEEAEKNLKPYPAAKEGQIRHVIMLPHKERGEENDFRVELIVGRTMMTDGVNLMRMGGTFEEKTVEGWGYNYFQAFAGPVAQTLMAPMEDQPQVEKFVTMPAKLIDYNSRLPSVVYTSPGMEVRYRLWSAGAETLKAETR